LDRHKDLHPIKKLRKRAGALVSKLSKLVESENGHQLRKNVTLHFEANDPILDFNKHRLRPDLNDDFLIASILQFRNDDPEALPVLVTADLGLKMKARHHRIEVSSLPDRLKLPDEPDEDQKQIRDLQARLTEHENRAPKLRMAFTDQDGLPEVNQVIFGAISEPTVREAVDTHRVSLETADQMNPIWKLMPLSAAAEQKYQRRMEEHLAEYTTYIVERQEANAKRARTICLEIILINEGTAPADDVDVFLKFPAELDVQDEDPNPPIPKEPKPPMRPTGGIFDVLELANFSVPQEDYSFLNNITPPQLERPNVSAPTLIKNPDGIEAQVNVRRSKQSQIQPLGMLYASFANQDAVGSFQIQYELHAANVPRAIKGHLQVVVKKTSDKG
ncbi:PIN domain-containing protein, partial [Myxococcus virescens]